MYHSITFGDKNTWDDWHLVPSSRPLFNPPTVKTKFISIPGANGILDLTESLTKYPVYNNREGSIEFIVMNDYWEWHEAYSTIMNYLHGKTMKAVLEDDEEWYYIGRFSVNSWKSEKDYSRIVIDYSLRPYKYSVTGVLENWLWDPFNFHTGVITSSLFANIVVEDTKTMEFVQRDYGGAPTWPTFTVSKEMKMRFINSYMGVDKEVTLYPETENWFDELLFYGLEVKIIFTLSDQSTEHGRVSINFIKGGL